MDMEKLLILAFNYGVPSVALIVVCFGTWKLVLVVIKNNKDREDKLMNFMKEDVRRVADSQAALAVSLYEFQKENRDAHSYQRSEHERIMAKLK